MKIAVLGGFGLMAEAALHDLAANSKVQSVLAVDLNLSRAKSVLARVPNRRKVKALKLDLTDVGAAARTLKGADCVLNAAWYEFNLQAMDLALALKAHYVDLGGLYHMTLKQLAKDREFRRQGLLAALGCGSTPGITNMMVARMAQSFEKIESVGIYDASYDPSLGGSTFLPPFSIRTMLAEYEAPAPVLEGGRIKIIPAHSRPEELDFNKPIGRCRVQTVIHSELATLPRYLRGKGVKSMAFKIFYPEVVERQLATLIGIGLSQDIPVSVNGGSVTPRRFITALAAQNAAALPGVPRDFEILRVKTLGSRHGKPLMKSWDCEIRPSRLLSAGAMGVGFTGAIASVMLVAAKTQAAAGAFAPESILDGDHFFRELRARKVFSLVETIAHPLELR